MRFPPLAYDGQFLATAEGSQLLVYDGDSEGPLFMSELDGDVVSIAIDGGHVFALSAHGLLRELDEVGATVNESRTQASRGVVAAGDRVCVYGPRATLIHGSERRELDVDRVSAAAFSPEGKKLLVCSELGTAHVFDTATAALAGTSSAPGPFAGAAWSAAGHFIATVHAKAGGVGKVDPTNGTVSPLIGTGEYKLDAVSASEDGRFIAVRVEDGRILIFDAARNRPVGNLTYGPPETPGGVAFGPTTWLAVAIGHGDANKVDLSTAAVHRTDPHEGRPRHRWSLLADIDVDRVNEVLNRAEVPAGRPSALAGAGAALPTSRPAQKSKLGIVVALAIVGLWALYSLLGR